MRQSVSLSNLFDLLEALTGVGPKRAALIAKACGGPRILDLLFHLPDRIAARMRVAHAADALPDTDAVLLVKRVAIRAATSRVTRRRYIEVRTE